MSGGVGDPAVEHREGSAGVDRLGRPRDTGGDALIDGGQARAALRLIEPKLQAARLQSSWLLRRGRARLALQQTVAGRADLRAASAEIDARLNLARPDTDLLLDRAQAALLLGDTPAARRDLDRAEVAGAAPYRLEKLRRLLKLRR